MSHALPPPSDWVRRWAALVPRGEVLDLACGQGRHARLFASLGHRVTALDRDRAALAALDGVPGVDALQADLENGSRWPFGPGRFAGVVVTNYLYRPLFRHLIDALAPGGVLIYETFMSGNERFGKPSNPQFLLAPGELLASFAGELTVAAFEQGKVERPKAAMIQRLCALKGAAGDVALAP
jgi:SAM-dependent methyltransferase